MPTEYTVQQGDCLSSIADDFGFLDYRTIYDDPLNDDFRALRPNPNLIYPGDVLYIPDRDGKDEDRPTNAQHTFVARVSYRFLRLKMLYDDGTPIASKAYKLTTRYEECDGTTGGDGKIEELISNKARSATLEIDGATWNLNIGNLNPLENCGDNGVSGYQARLKNLGYDPGPIDGIDGPRTQAAVSAFQADNPPLVVDGIFGVHTMAKLKEIYGF
jgi:hypothetical protein